MGIRPLTIAAACLAAAVLVAGCGRDDNSASAAGPTDTAAQKVSGKIEADGSSTVGPLTTAAAELFREQQPGVNVTVGISGTGGGDGQWADSHCSPFASFSHSVRVCAPAEEAWAQTW